MHVERNILLQFKDEARGVTFRVERWFMAVDDKTESMTKAVLVWDDGDGTERFVLLGRKVVRAVIDELASFA